MTLRPILLTLLLVNLHMVAHAQFFKCKEADGRYTIQDTPCPVDPGSPDRKRPKLKELNEASMQKKMDNRPGANWEPHSDNARNFQINPLQQATPAQTNAIRSPAATAEREPWKDKDREYQKRRAEEQVKAYNDQVKADNRNQRCNHARQQLGVAKENRPIYRRDNKGDRIYVDDENRQAEITAAEQRVAEACK